MRSLDEAELIRLLEDGRPAADAEFSRELDEWAAAGFPRGGWRAEQEPAPISPARRLLDRVLATPPRRLLAPVGAFAVFAVVATVAVVQIADRDGERVDPSILQELDPERRAPDGEAASSLQDAPAAPEAKIESAPLASPDAAATGGAAGRVDGAASIPPVPGGRQVHREVELALSTQPEDLRDVADSVVDVADAHGGLVISSNVASLDPIDGRAASGRADFALRIPVGELQPVLDELSDLAHVASRSDGSVDITARFRSVRGDVRQLIQERERLVEELAEAATPAERRRIRAQVNSVDARLEAAAGRLDNLRQRVKMVPLSVTVTGEGEPDDGEWGIADALDDAGQVLTTSLGVLLVGAAALVPLALLIALGARAWRVLSHQRRERALDAG